MVDDGIPEPSPTSLTSEPANLRPADHQLFLQQVLAEQDGSANAVYLGALRVLADEGNPDRLALTAHSIRELMEKLPKYFNLPMADREKMGDKLAPVRAVWTKNRLKMNPDEALPRMVWDKLEAFFTWCETELLTWRQKTAELLQGLDPAGGALPQPIERDRVQQWLDCHDFFVRSAHHGSCSEEELQSWLSVFEHAVLDRVRPRTFDNADALDALIAEGEGHA